MDEERDPLGHYVLCLCADKGFKVLLLCGRERPFVADGHHADFRNPPIHDDDLRLALPAVSPPMDMNRIVIVRKEEH